jgi:hypothetical protein
LYKHVKSKMLRNKAKKNPQISMERNPKNPQTFFHNGDMFRKHVKPNGEKGHPIFPQGKFKGVKILNQEIRDRIRLRVAEKEKKNPEHSHFAVTNTTLYGSNISKLSELTQSGKNAVQMNSGPEVMTPELVSSFYRVFRDMVEKKEGVEGWRMENWEAPEDMRAEESTEKAEESTDKTKSTDKKSSTENEAKKSTDKNYTDKSCTDKSCSDESSSEEFFHLQPTEAYLLEASSDNIVTSSNKSSTQIHSASPMHLPLHVDVQDIIGSLVTRKQLERLISAYEVARGSKDDVSEKEPEKEAEKESGDQKGYLKTGIFRKTLVAVHDEILERKLQEK